MLKYLLAMISLVSLAYADETADSESKTKRLERWGEYYKEVAKGYDMRLKSAPDEPLLSKPIMVYSNPTIGFDTHGTLFVWTRNGRPEVVGAIWSKKIDASANGRKNVNHEFFSLATETLTAKGSDGTQWTPNSPGIELKPVPEAPVPAATRALRLIQMREISRKFTAFDRNTKEGYPGQDEERRLRLLPAPMYRYTEAETPRESNESKKESAVEDGALFGLFYDWDPEIILVIETRPTSEGPRWHYGVGYLDCKPLRVQFQEKDVWQKPDWDYGNANSKYYLAVGVTTRPVDFE